MIAGNAPSRHRTMADDRKAVRFSGHHVNVAKQSSGHYKILAGATVHKSVNMAPWAPLKCKAWPINAQHTHPPAFVSRKHRISCFVPSVQCTGSVSSARCSQISQAIHTNFIFLASSGQLPALSLQKPRFDPRLDHVTFLVDTLALGKISLPLLRFPLSVSLIIPPMLHTAGASFTCCSYQDIALKVPSKQCYFGNPGTSDRTVLSLVS